MSKIEEVKKILEHHSKMARQNTTLNEDAFVIRICQLFEPKPDKGRLLTDEEINEIANAIDVSEYPTSVDYWEAIIQAELKAQRDLTASIKDTVYAKLADIVAYFKNEIKLNTKNPYQCIQGICRKAGWRKVKEG